MALALALFARPANDLAPSATLGTGPADGEKRLLIDDLTPAAAGGTTHQTVFRLRTLSLAAGAFFETRHLNIGGQAAHGVLETDLEVVTDIVTTLGARSTLPRSAAEDIAETEHVAKDVAQIREAGRIES